MEKYRRWTDETAGVNPFVAANSPTPFLTKLVSFFALIVKGSIFLAYLPLFILLTLQPINLGRRLAAGGLLLLLGVYEHEDYSLEKAQKGSRNSIIMCNHTCLIDIIYFLYRFPGCSFMGFNEDKEGKITYHTVSPLNAVLSLLASLQVFYRISQRKGYDTLKQLQAASGLKQDRLIVFYQKIRTNGRGTIRLEKSLAEQIYQLERDVIVTQIKYSLKKDALFSLTASPPAVLSSALGTIVPGNNMKLRATKLAYKDTHSANELRQGVNSFVPGALLETAPRSYFQFIEFFHKTQKEGYKLDE